MSNSIQSFKFNENTPIRVIDKQWFVAKDVCSGLDIKNHKQAIKSLKSNLDEAGIEGVISNDPLVKTTSGVQKMVAVNETGLNLLIMQSRKKEAIKFKYWIASEVLPAIRKTGQYKRPELNKDEKGEIYALVHEIARQRGITPHPIWAKLKRHFRYSSYHDLLPEQYEEAKNILQGELVDRHNIVPFAKPETQIDFEVTPENQIMRRFMVIKRKNGTLDCQVIHDDCFIKTIEEIPAMINERVEFSPSLAMKIAKVCLDWSTKVVNKLEFESKGENITVMKMPDDSMRPTIGENMNIEVDTSITEITSGGVYAFVHNGRFLVRRIFIENHRFVCDCDNITHHSKGRRAPLGAIDILGRVVGYAGNRDL